MNPAFRDDSSRPTSRLAKTLLCGILLAVLSGCDEPNVTQAQAQDMVPTSGDLGASNASAQDHPVLKEDERFGLSLRVLARHVAKAASAGEDIPERLGHLQGMGWIEGFVVDRAHEDIILIGRYSTKRPPLQLDDLVIAIRNVWSRQPAPYCSLDPRAEDIRRLNRLKAAYKGGDFDATRAHFQRLQEAWGPQQVVIGGVPKDSRFGAACIDADYHMKAVSQSHAQLQDVDGMFQRSIDAFYASLEAGDPPERANGGMSRFWFHVKEDPRFRESDGIVLLDSCGVRLLTEEQVATADGELHDSNGPDDPQALAFAADFSEHLEQGTLEPRFQDLENLYRLYALTKAMRLRDVEQVLGSSWGFYRTAYQPARYSLPDALDGLTNFKEVVVTRENGRYRETIYFFPLVMGGGTFEMRVEEQSFNRDDAGPIVDSHAAILVQRPNVSSLYWPIVLGGAG